MKPAIALLLAASAAGAQAQNLSFVACPVVRDTKTTPCWLAEYKGELYFLGLQGGVAQDFYPPQLNHEVLVEGAVAPGPRVCGGIPLQPVKISVILEINRACNTILPAEDGIEAPRPARSAMNSWTRQEGLDAVTIFFDFDNDFLSLHTTGAVRRIAQRFLETKAAALEVTAHRGASKLSDGTMLTEKPAIAAERAAKVRDILLGLGVPASALRVRAVNEPPVLDGANDPWSRKVTLAIQR